MRNLYERYLLPRLLRCACGSKPVQYQRKKVVPLAHGTVLEVGMGSGANLPFYEPNKVDLIYGLEPSEGMRALARPAVQASRLNVEIIDLPGEQIPLADDSIDCVLLTYTLCTIPDRPTALAQMRRVLKPGGQLIFCEHGLAPDQSTANWQRRIEPLWSKLAGGCHVTIPMPQVIHAAGFVIESLDEMYLPNTPKPLGYTFWGVASPSA